MTDYIDIDKAFPIKKDKGKSVGTIGDIGTFSFCQSKHFTTGGEGGIELVDFVAGSASASRFSALTLPIPAFPTSKVLFLGSAY
ncbi:DegT/DnrJ/EryC1/StrS family aminotransferase [Xenorhabdus lircayensis]|uniref:DegT/DnrJ/EryC1/StrS family aminotransferase n=1 Tax=Xenorhabdus lircayensis TaxID=2763499 RepID=UPI002FCB575B